MTWAEKEKKINRFAKAWARITGTSHLPQRGLVCEVCGQPGHLVCWDVPGPDTEHLFIELDNIERRAA